jgi:hypothetical protein
MAVIFLAVRSLVLHVGQMTLQGSTPSLYRAQQNDAILGDHSNFRVGHRNFTAWIKYTKFKNEPKIPSPVHRPQQRRNSCILLHLPYIIWLNLLSVGRLIFCQTYLSALIMWRLMVAAFHWPHCNRKFNYLKVLISPNEHIERNTVYEQNNFTCIIRHSVITNQSV